MVKPIVKKLLIVAAICLGAVVLAGSFVLYKSNAKKAAAEKLHAEQIAADKAAANRIYRQTGIKIPGTINGEPFFTEDLNVYRSELRAAVAAYYGQKYSISSMGASFWDTRYDGITPMEHMTNLAINDLKKNMVIIQQARIRGIDTPAAYSDLEEERAAWNAPTDEIVYGPKTLAPMEFISYRLTGITDALKTELLKNELAPTEAQLRSSYADLPPHLKIAPYRASGTRFTWGESSDWERRAQYLEVSDSDKKYNEEVFAAVTGLLGQGFSAEQVVNALSDLYPRLLHEEFSINSRAVSRAIEYDQALAENLREVKAGSCIPGPFDMPALYHISEKEGGAYYRFEEAPGLGRNKWINDQFELFIAQKIKEARVTLFSDEDFDL